MLTSSYGTGQLIRAALDQGCRKLLITIGGSATVDGGMGLLSALGVQFLNADGKQLPPVGQSLVCLAAVDISGLDQRLKACSVQVACDVNNPLCGPLGAAPVFGPQKGATKEMVGELSAGLENYARLTMAATKRDVAGLPGAGAAGGVGAALMAYLGAELRSGVDAVLDTLQVDDILRDTDLVITGEGRMDGQTAQGKAPTGIAQRGQKYGCATVALVGSLEPGYEAVYQQGISAVFPLVNRPMSLQQAMDNAASLLQDCAGRVIRLYRLGRED
jgi:glycerate kinase